MEKKFGTVMGNVFLLSSSHVMVGRVHLKFVLFGVVGAWVLTPVSMPRSG